MNSAKHRSVPLHLLRVVIPLSCLLLLPGLAAASEPELDGSVLYHDYCSVCHGDRGDGRSRASGSLMPDPVDFSDPEIARQLTRDRMIFSVKYGRPDTAMAPWGTQLTQQQVESVVDFVRDRFMSLEHEQQHTAGGEHPEHGDHGGGHQHQIPTGDVAEYMAQAYPGNLRGDPEQGKQFYQDNCALCHGKAGDGNGHRAYFIMPKPRDFRHPAVQQSLNRPHLFEAIAMGSRGTDMPAWSKVIDDQQLANVSEYVFRTFVRPMDDHGTIELKPSRAHGSGTMHAGAQAHQESHHDKPHATLSHDAHHETTTKGDHHADETTVHGNDHHPEPERH